MSSAIGPILLSVSLVGAVGVIHGIGIDRWGPSGQLETALAGLNRIPTTCGDWVGDDAALEPEDMARAGIKGWVFRRYRNPRSREAVSMLLVCGRGGPICVHTPDVCYAGAGYEQIGEKKLADIDLEDNGRHTFHYTRFKKLTGTVPSQLEVYWAWSRDGRSWQAPENPRLSFARSPALYKLYVVREFATGSRDETSEACKNFIKRALPDFRRSLDLVQP